MQTKNSAPDIHWTNIGDHDVHGARLAGSLDEHTVGQLRELSKVVFGGTDFSNGDHFLIDVTEVTEIDDIGLAALVGIVVALAAHAGSVGLILPHDHPVRPAFRVTGLDRVFDIHETRQEANRVVLALRRLQLSG